MLLVLFFPLINSAQNSNSDNGSHGLQGHYYAAVEPKGRPVLERNDGNLQFNWEVSPPLEAPFFALWDGTLTVEKSGFYGFLTVSDDASWLWLDGKITVDNSGEHTGRTVKGNVFLSHGPHRIRVEYVNYMGGALMLLKWCPPDSFAFDSIPNSVLQ